MDQNINTLIEVCSLNHASHTLHKTRESMRADKYDIKANGLPAPTKQSLVAHVQRGLQCGVWSAAVPYSGLQRSLTRAPGVLEFEI